MAAMKFIDFKTDKIGETQVLLTEDPFKGTNILIRSNVTAVMFNGEFDEKGKPKFGITVTNNIIIVPPQTDIRKSMK
jgi:hypothetical protein